MRQAEDKTVSLSAEELREALKLLEHEPARELGQAVLSLAVYVAIGVVLVCLPLGLLIVPFDHDVGVALLASAGAGLVVGGATSLRAPVTKKAALQSALAQTPLSTTANEVWAERQRPYLLSLGALMIVSLGSAAVGLVLLLISLIGSSEVSWLGFALIVAPFLAFWVLSAVGSYRQYRYYASVTKVRHRLAGYDEGGEVSADELAVISRAEREQIDRTISRLAQEPDVRQKAAYALVMTPQAQEDLSGVAPTPEAWQQVRSAIDSLQVEPRPAAAEAAIADTTYTLRADGHRVAYLVDDEARRVVVLGVSGGPVGS